MQSRTTKLLSEILANDKAPLACHYGAVAGLGELGTEVRFWPMTLVCVLVPSRCRTKRYKG